MKAEWLDNVSAFLVGVGTILLAIPRRQDQILGAASLVAGWALLAVITCLQSKEDYQRGAQSYLKREWSITNKWRGSRSSEL